MSDNRTYTLTLSPDYVAGWGVWEAVRELLQNAIDQRTRDSEADVVFQYDKTRRELTVGSTTGELSRKTLLIGGGDKHSDKATIGHFGEGYKLACLVLARRMQPVEILNGQYRWVPKFAFSDEYDEHVLTIQQTAAEKPVPGVYFRIGDFSEADFGEVVERYLPDAPINSILEESYLRKRVFVGGLFVCEIKELEYGYNFHPSRIRLGRDRMMAPTFEVSFEASRLWENNIDNPALYECLQNGSLDVQYVSSVGGQTGEYVVDRYLKEHPGAIPVSSQQEADRFKGCRVSIVPAALRTVLRGLHEFVFHRQGTPCERLEAWFHGFGGKLGPEARREFRGILKESKAWYGCVDAGSGETDDE